MLQLLRQQVGALLAHFDLGDVILRYDNYCTGLATGATGTTSCWRVLHHYPMHDIINRQVTTDELPRVRIIPLQHDTGWSKKADTRKTVWVSAFLDHPVYETQINHRHHRRPLFLLLLLLLIRTNYSYKVRDMQRISVQKLTKAVSLTHDNKMLKN